jgi:hypothetical protein
MYYKLTLLICLFATYASPSQTLSEDGTNDSTEVRRFNALCKAATGRGEFDSAFYYTGKALHLAVSDDV